MYYLYIHLFIHLFIIIIYALIYYLLFWQRVEKDVIVRRKYKRHHTVNVDIRNLMTTILQTTTKIIILVKSIKLVFPQEMALCGSEPEGVVVDFDPDSEMADVDFGG